MRLLIGVQIFSVFFFFFDNALLIHIELVFVAIRVICEKKEL